MTTTIQTIATLLLGVFLLTGVAVALTPQVANAQGAAAVSAGLNETATAAYGTAGTAIPLPTLIGRIIQALLGVTGVIFLVLTVYAGFLYMTAGGEPDKVKKAKQIIGQSIIGLIIIIGAYAITGFVVTALATATSGPQVDTDGG